MNENARGPYKVGGWFYVLTLIMALLCASAGKMWLPQLLGVEVTVLSQVVSAIACGTIGGVVTSVALNLAASLFRRRAK